MGNIQYFIHENTHSFQIFPLIPIVKMSAISSVLQNASEINTDSRQEYDSGIKDFLFIKGNLIILTYEILK